MVPLYLITWFEPSRILVLVQCLVGPARRDTLIWTSRVLSKKHSRKALLVFSYHVGTFLHFKGTVSQDFISLVYRWLQICHSYSHVNTIMQYGNPLGSFFYIFNWRKYASVLPHMLQFCSLSKVKLVCGNCFNITCRCSVYQRCEKCWIGPGAWNKKTRR